jgi:hypothetical protein
VNAILSVVMPADSASVIAHTVQHILFLNVYHIKIEQKS